MVRDQNSTRYTVHMKTVHIEAPLSTNVKDFVKFWNIVAHTNNTPMTPASQTFDSKFSHAITLVIDFLFPITSVIAYPVLNH